MKNELDQQLDQMLTAGIIRKSDVSPFASPVVMVKKGNGEYRFALTTDDLIDRLSRCTTNYHAYKT